MRLLPLRIVRGLATALVAVASLAFAVPAYAQGLAPSATFHAWAPVGTATLAVTAASARVAFPTPGPVALICNTGTKSAFLAFGVDNTIVATVTGFLITAGTCRPYSIKPFATQFTYLASIAGGSDSTTLDIETGIGSP